MSSCYLCLHRTFTHQCVNVYLNVCVIKKGLVVCIGLWRKIHFSISTSQTTPVVWENSSCCVLSVKPCSVIPSDSRLVSQWVGMISLCLQKSSTIQVSTSVLWLVFVIECVTCYMGVILSSAAAQRLECNIRGAAGKWSDLQPNICVLHSSSTNHHFLKPLVFTSQLFISISVIAHYIQ